MKHTMGKRELDAEMQPCPNCGGDHMELRAACHPEAALTIQYDRPLAVVILLCHECDLEVTRIKVAP